MFVFLSFKPRAKSKGYGTCNISPFWTPLQYLKEGYTIIYILNKTISVWPCQSKKAIKIYLEWWQMKVLQEYPLSLQGSLKQKQYIIQLTIEVLDVG